MQLHVLQLDEQTIILQKYAYVIFIRINIVFTFEISSQSKVMAPLVSLPPQGAASPPRPPPRSTADSAATIPTAAPLGAAMPSLLVHGSTSPLSPHAKHFQPSGLSKSLYWNDSGLASSTSAGSVFGYVRSYWEVVAHARDLQAPATYRVVLGYPYFSAG